MSLYISTIDLASLFSENQRKPKRHAVWQYNESVGGDWNIFPQDFMDEIETLYQTDPTGKSELVSVNTT